VKRDDDLIREILTQVEAAPANAIPKVSLPERDPNEVLEHLELLREAGLLEAKVAHSGRGGARIDKVIVTRMTWTGHEFLQNARNEEVWQRTKKLVKERGGSVSFEILTALLVQTAKGIAGLQ
jgi:hypothetical protein